MILLVHMLFGAAVGLTIINIPLAIIVAFLSHYFLDLFPHIEYNIKLAKESSWKRKLFIVAKIATDFFLGLLLVLLFSKNQPIAYLYSLIAIIPDALTVLGKIFPNKIFLFHTYIHTQKVHFLKYKKISNFWRVLSQLMAIIISIILLRF